MKLCIIIARGKHKKRIYFTNNSAKYWSDNIEDAKIYTEGRARNRLKTMRYNNPSMLPIYIGQKNEE